MAADQAHVRSPSTTMNGDMKNHFSSPSSFSSSSSSSLPSQSEASRHPDHYHEEQGAHGGVSRTEEEGGGGVEKSQKKHFDTSRVACQQEVVSLVSSSSLNRVEMCGINGSVDVVHKSHATLSATMKVSRLSDDACSIEKKKKKGEGEIEGLLMNGKREEEQERKEETLKMAKKKKNDADECLNTDLDSSCLPSSSSLSAGTPVMPTKGRRIPTPTHPPQRESSHHNSPLCSYLLPPSSFASSHPVSSSSSSSSGVYTAHPKTGEKAGGASVSKAAGGGAAATAAPTTSAATTIRILTNSSSSSSAAVLGGGKNKGGVLGGGSSASGVQCHSHLRFFSHLPPYDRSICPMSSFETDGKAPVFQSSIPGGGKRRKHQKGIGWKRDFKEYPLQTRIAMDFRQDLVHPAVIRIGLQMGKRKVTGTNARTVAMLTAFQRFIEDYCPAPYEAIEKHLKITLDRQINFITHCRPHSLAMGGVIRWLKRRLSRYATMPLQDTKRSLCTDISTFIRERILVATCAVADGFQSIIEPGDCLMVFGKSTAVLRALLEAKKNGFRFSVVVVDSHPHLNGQVTARICAAAGIEVSYTLLNGISYHIEDVTKVVLGAAALLANASVVGRAGSAVVAMEGKVHAKPVLVLCESYKMFDKIVLDSCSFNELDDPQLVWERAKSPPHAFSEDVPIYYPSSSSHMPLSQTRRSSQAGEEKEHDGEGGFDEGDVRMNERERKEREGEHASHHKTASHKVKGGSPFLASCIPSSPLLRNGKNAEQPIAVSPSRVSPSLVWKEEEEMLSSPGPRVPLHKGGDGEDSQTDLAFCIRGRNSFSLHADSSTRKEQQPSSKDESPAIPSQEKSSSASSSSRRRRKSGAEEKTVFSPSFCDSSSSSSSSSKTPDIGRREPGGEGEQEDEESGAKRSGTCSSSSSSSLLCQKSSHQEVLHIQVDGETGAGRGGGAGGASSMVFMSMTSKKFITREGGGGGGDSKGEGGDREERGLTTSSSLGGGVGAMKPEVCVMNLCYDVTPSHFIDFIIMDTGVFAASNVPALVRGFGSTSLVDRFFLPKSVVENW